MLRTLCLSLVCLATQAQTLTLEQCYDLARTNYPLTRQNNLLALTNEYTLANISRGNWPQVAITGQASYQSDVVKLPSFIQGPKIPKDQYRLTAEVNQPLTDLITTSRQQKLQDANHQVQVQNLEADLYKLKDRINQIYFGILLLREQRQQVLLKKKDIQLGLDRVKSALINGTEMQMNVDRLQAELLKAEQSETELIFGQHAYALMLGLLLHQPVSDSVSLSWPVDVTAAGAVARPELVSFEHQLLALDAQTKFLNTKVMPKFSLFVQAGWGQPSPLNLLNPSLSGYALGGLRLNWSISNFYTHQKEKQLITLNQEMVRTQRDAFLLNTDITRQSQQSEVEKLQALLRRDDEITTLLHRVKQASAQQLQHGVVTSYDYLREVNAEDQARQSAVLHKVQLSLALYNLQYTTGH